MFWAHVSFDMPSNTLLTDSPFPCIKHLYFESVNITIWTWHFWFKSCVVPSGFGGGGLVLLPTCCLNMRIRFWPPPPTPEFLTKDFPSATRCRMEILTKENLVGAKIAPTAVSRTPPTKDKHWKPPLPPVRKCLPTDLLFFFAELITRKLTDTDL